MKTLRELRQAHAQKLESYNTAKEEGKSVDELRSLFNEVKEAKEMVELQEREDLLNLDDPTPIDERTNEIEVEVRNLSAEDVDAEYENTFLRAFRGKKLSERDMDLYERMCELRAVPNATPYLQTAVDENGGFIVPKSVSTQINEYKRAMEFDLTTLVDYEKTSVIAGSFVYEKLATIKPFNKISQWDTIEEVGTPQFEQKKFSIEDYAGILPIPRTLLQDTDQNLLAHIAKFIARKTLVTRNKAVMDVINATFGTKSPVATVDDFKDILNVKLDSAFLSGTSIITNQDGFNFLDKLKDGDNNYLLQSDVKDPTQKRLLGYAVKVIPNRTLPTVGKKAPIFVGNMAEAIRFYDRGVYEVTPTTIGGKAWERNSLDIRVIDRFGVIALDPVAVVAGEITVTP